MNVPRVGDAADGSATNGVFGAAGEGVIVAFIVAALVAVSLSEVGAASGVGIKKRTVKPAATRIVIVIQNVRISVS